MSLSPAQIRWRKHLILFAVFISWLPIWLFMDYTKFKLGMEMWAFVARFCAITGTVLLFWGYVLSARGLIGKFITDLGWATELHRKFGRYGFYLIIIHFICISVFYAQVRGINLISFTFNRPEQFYKNLGIVGLALILFIAFTSVYIRKRLTYRSWHRLHLTSYLILPLALIHNIGLSRTDDLIYTSARPYWITMLIAGAFIYIYMALFGRGKFKPRFDIVRIDLEADKVSNIILMPLTTHLYPQPGQYIYVQIPGKTESHPFSVTSFDPVSGAIGINPKALGKFSTHIQSVAVGDDLLVDGPYGVFTEEVYTSHRPIVFLAGGIGIVPFMPSIYNLAKGMQRSVTLIYGNNSLSEVAFIDEIAEVQTKASDLQVIHVLKQLDTPRPNFESGFISQEIITKYVSAPFDKYEYFVCGPPVMIESMKKILSDMQIPDSQIHFEKFSN